MSTSDCVTKHIDEATVDRVRDPDKLDEYGTRTANLNPQTKTKDGKGEMH